MEKPAYLAKFFNDIQYAQRLLSLGELYMRPAQYYIQLEQRGKNGNQGDRFEGACSHTLGISKGVNHPIYCMMQIMPQELSIDRQGRTYFSISSLVCEGFFSNQEAGVVVVIPYSDFVSRITPTTVGGRYCRHRSVIYGNINSLESAKMLFVDDRMSSLFIKRPKFSYQREYRICISEDLPISEEEINNSHLTIYLGDFSTSAHLIHYSQFEAFDDGFHLYIT